MTKYVNKGDSAYPRTNFLPEHYVECPGLLQSDIANLQNQIRATYRDLYTMIDLLKNTPDISDDLKLEMQTGIKLARRSVLLLGEMQVMQKHKRRLLVGKLRSDKAALSI